jgi:hypothetical protein
MGPAVEINVLAPQADEFRHSEACLEGEEQQGVIATAYPGIAVGDSQQSIHLVAREEVDRLSLAPLAGDREDPLDEG